MFDTNNKVSVNLVLVLVLLVRQQHQLNLVEPILLPLQLAMLPPMHLLLLRLLPSSSPECLLQWLPLQDQSPQVQSLVMVSRVCSLEALPPLKVRHPPSSNSNSNRVVPAFLTQEVHVHISITHSIHHLTLLERISKLS